MSGPLPPTPVGASKGGYFQEMLWKGYFLGVKKDSGKGLAY